MSSSDNEKPKEGRFVHSKILKTDSIIETRKLLHKLELMAKDLHHMSEEEIEKLWPQTSVQKSSKTNKKTEKEFLISLLMAAGQSIATREFFNKYEINLNDSSIRDALKPLTEELTRGH